MLSASLVGLIFLPSLQAETSQTQTAPISQVNSNQASQVEPIANRSSSKPYEDMPGPGDWTRDTPIKLYNGLNSMWEDKVFVDIGPGVEFIVGDYVYATTPEKGFLFAKPELTLPSWLKPTNLFYLLSQMDVYL